ncbi:hypothetical protein FHN55_09710 [Streptomyces sp. NP160]|nr:hypothetical protein FHN55_09710 [Streptomyces sp. NP160]
MPDPRAHRSEPQAPAPEHARHRAPRGTAVRRRTALLALGLVVVAAAVVAVAVARQPPGPPTSGPATSASTPSSASSAGSDGTGTGAAGSGADPSSAEGAVQAAAVWLAGQPGRAGQPGGVAVDPELYDDLASSAQLASRLVPAPVAAGSGDVAAQWVVAGPSLRDEAAPGSWTAQALAGSRTVAVFGDGDGRVEVRELDGTAASGEPVVPLAAGADRTTSPPVTSAPPRATATAADAAALAELQRNPRLDFSPRAREALRDQRVDLRLAALLAQLAAQQPLSVSDLPAGGGGTEPLRTVVIDGIAGQPVGADPDALAQLERQLTAQDPSYRATPQEERDGPAQVLRLVLPSAGV